MPSRTRIVLRNTDREPITNDHARKMLIALVAKDILWKTGLPEGWAKLKLRGKLEYLKTLLPPEWVLEVYTEPRATRPTRSVYKSQFVGERKGRRRAKKVPQPHQVEYAYDLDPVNNIGVVINENRQPQVRDIIHANLPAGWARRPE